MKKILDFFPVVVLVFLIGCYDDIDYTSLEGDWICRFDDSVEVKFTIWGTQPAEYYVTSAKVVVINTTRSILEPYDEKAYVRLTKSGNSIDHLTFVITPDLDGYQWFTINLYDLQYNESFTEITAARADYSCNNFEVSAEKVINAPVIIRR